MVEWLAMDQAIKCPHCGRDIEISQALRHQIEAELKKEGEEELEKHKKAAEEQIKKELLQKQGIELEELRRDLLEKDKTVSELLNQEGELRNKMKSLEEKERELKLEVQKQVAEQKVKLEEEILTQAAQEHRFKDLENQKRISDLMAALEEAKRKAQQGSQQLQGEVLELDLEATLKSTFPSDEFQPVGKGVKGADIKHIVKSPKGFVCGVILWESKRTKAWSDGWCIKLKDDLRAEKANIPIIVSSVLPKEARDGMGVKDGVWVCSFALALQAATLLRKGLLDIAFERAKLAHKDGKLDNLYEYITSHEFRQQVEAVIEVYQDMQIQIAKEKSAFEKIWRVREGQISRLMNSTANMVGSIQGKIGQSALQVKGLDDIFELESGK